MTYWPLIIIPVASVQIALADPAVANSEGADALCAIQDARMSDILAVQKVMSSADSGSKNAVLAAFQQRDSVRAEEAGEISAKLEKDRLSALGQMQIEVSSRENQSEFK